MYLAFVLYSSPVVSLSSTFSSLLSKAYKSAMPRCLIFILQFGSWKFFYLLLFSHYCSVLKLSYYLTFCHRSLLNARTCVTFPLLSLVNFNGNDCSLQKNSTFDLGTKFISFPSHSCLSVR